MIKKLEHLKAKVEKARFARIRAEAALDEANARIRELGFDDIEAAETALHDLEKQADEVESKIKAGMAQLEKQYPDIMEDL